MDIENKYEVLRELWRVVEWRNGAVYRTEYVTDVWIPLGVETASTGYLYVMKCTHFSGETIRRKK